MASIRTITVAALAVTLLAGGLAPAKAENELLRSILGGAAGAGIGGALGGGKGAAIGGVLGLGLGALSANQLSHRKAQEPAAAQPIQRDLTFAVQNELVALGYAPGPVDGINGQRTQEAIRAYQYRFGLPIDGIASWPLLDHMRYARTQAARTQQQPAAYRATAAARDDVPPVITAPSLIETQAAMIKITGSLADDSGIVEFNIDGRPVPLDADGGFSALREVPLGESWLALVAVDAWGNRVERELHVISRRPVAQEVAVKRDEAPPVIDVPAMLETEKAVVELAGKVSRLTPAQALGIDPGRYHALVIGNDTYRDMPNLNTAVADARAVAATLERDYGFQVELLEDATGYRIKSSISRLRRTLTENDNLLVYYAGHGVVDPEAEAGFWLPVDAERDSDANWIANDYLTRNLRAMSAKHVMVVADSCYSGTLVRAAPAAVRSGRERTAWLARMAGKKSRTAMVSGGLEPVMDAGGGDHSVFAKAFLEALAENDGVLDGQALFARIQRPVILNSDQTPDYADIRRAGHDGGDFLFVRR